MSGCIWLWLKVSGCMWMCLAVSGGIRVWLVYVGVNGCIWVYVGVAEGILVCLDNPPFQPPPIQGLLFEEVWPLINYNYIIIINRAFPSILFLTLIKIGRFYTFCFTWAKAPGNTRARHRVATAMRKC